MAELAFDVVEDILVRLDVKDLIRCKSVCKSWQSFISSPRFVKAHLKHSYKNDLDNHELGHRRISMVLEDDFLYIRNRWGTNPSILHKYDWVGLDHLVVVGSSNGLVCVSQADGEFVVTNPSTREQKKLSTPPYPPNMEKLSIRDDLCWGFGYDSSIDDYKVIVGLWKVNQGILFYVLTLKSNIWKFIGQVKCDDEYYIDDKSGILCDGALYWFMFDNEDNKVIISLDLSTEEFKEIPQPVDEKYDCDAVDDYKLGVIEDQCLCIFLDCSTFSRMKWVMKNNKWERYNHDHYKNKYDVAHCITKSLLFYKYGVNDGDHVPNVESDFRAGIFVKSLVSPCLHVTNGGERKRNAKVPSKCLFL